ncbi:MAG: DMT family transporter, partial [Acidobacteriota bacterium]|nr:DMT family transporter [Acidobacteriota bacterium]
MKTWKADLALAAVTVIWGSTFVVVKNALGSVSPVLFLALRFTLAAVVLAALYRSRFDRRAVPAGIATGFLLFGGYFFQTVGLRLTTPTKSAFFTGLSIPMVPLVAALVYRKVPYLLEVIGVLFASVGMALMTLEGNALKPGGTAALQGNLLSFLCAVA